MSQIAFRLPELDLAPIGDSAATPADLDGDGLYEDVNGDGWLDSLDPALPRISLGVPSVGRNARAFDFDNDGELTEADVACLEEQVLRRWVPMKLRMPTRRRKLWPWRRSMPSSNRLL